MNSVPPPPWRWELNRSDFNNSIAESQCHWSLQSSQHVAAAMSQVSSGIYCHCTEVINQVPAGQDSGSKFGLCHAPHSLHAQVPGGGHLAWAASDRGDRQAAEKQVHGWKEGLQEADRAEGRTSVRSEVDLVGVGAGRLQRGLVLAACPWWKDGRKSLKCSWFLQKSHFKEAWQVRSKAVGRHVRLKLPQKSAKKIIKLVKKSELIWRTKDFFDGWIRTDNKLLSVS